MSRLGWSGDKDMFLFEELTDLHTHKLCMFLFECYTAIKMFVLKLWGVPLKLCTFPRML